MRKSKDPKPISKFTKGQKGYFRILKEYAGKFQQWLDLIERKDTRIGKRDTLYGLVNLVLEVNFQRVLGWLERTRPSMFGPLKRARNNILSGVKIIDQTKDVRYFFKPPMVAEDANQGSQLQNWPKSYTNPLWFSELHDKNMPHFRFGDIDFQELKERVLLLANLLEDTADDLQETKQPPEASEQKKGEKAKSAPEKLSAKARVLAILVEHQDWSDTKIAEAAGISRTTLYDYPEFKTARKVQKQNKGKIPRGRKDQEGNIEAFDK